MKNNIILILVVTVISIAVIIISVTVSLGGHSDEETSGDESSTTSMTTSRTEPDIEPVVITTEPQPPQSESPVEHEDTSETVASEAENIIALAQSLIGTEFADGGETPASGFDNSGFIYYVLRENGYITCPRGVAAQSRMGAVKEYDELVPGDLVFFSESGTSAEFGGIYAGEGVMIACLMPGTQVRKVDITTSYYTSNFYCGVGII
ncbi:MAG: C40 family peptidase [Oscillospiraceae bacterium]|nr:C40 family peptidase [Oscillospiraceae bacterium]